MRIPSLSQGYGISFSPAGLLTPFHIGVCHAFHERSLISASTQLAGSSGGALAAISACEYNNGIYKSEELLSSCEYIAQECRKYGTRGTLRVALDEIFSQIIPNDIIDVINNRSPIFIAYKQVSPTWSNEIVSTFHGRDDVIDVLRASCNIPFYFNGNNPFVKVRQGYGIDGFFAVPRHRFGCPFTNAKYEILVTPFLPSLVGLQAWDPTIHTDKKFDIISPASLSDSEWPFDIRALIRLALFPPKLMLLSPSSYKVGDKDPISDISSKVDGLDLSNDRNIRLTYEKIFKAGILCAERWLEQDDHQQNIKLLLQS